MISFKILTTELKLKIFKIPYSLKWNSFWPYLVSRCNDALSDFLKPFQELYLKASVTIDLIILLKYIDFVGWKTGNQNYTFL